tara:strand:- start:18220 stop:18843 length:624 start_codon:yes stop_codon:yes gene_type:complete
MSESQSVSGPKFLYRLAERAGLKTDKNEVWMQRRKWFIWKDWYHTENELRKARYDVVELVHKLHDALEAVEEHSKDEETAKARIRKDNLNPVFSFTRWFNPSVIVSNPFKGKAVPQELDLEDVKSEYDRLVKKYDLTSWIKEGASTRRSSGRQKTGFTLDGETPPSKEFLGDFKPHGWKDTRKNNQNQNQNQNRKQNKGNQNQNQNN